MARTKAAALDRELVVRAALRRLDEVGLDGLTVRGIADRLGVQASALYWHVRNKQDLLDRMAATMLADAFAGFAPPAAGETSTEWLAGLARTCRRALLAHRDGARVIAEADLGQSAMVDVLDLAVRVLQEAGFGPTEALVGTVAVLDYTLGATFEDQAEPLLAAGDRAVGGPRPLRAAIADRLPALAAALDGAEGAIGFEGGLRLLLIGIDAGRRRG